MAPRVIPGLVRDVERFGVAARSSYGASFVHDKTVPSRYTWTEIRFKILNAEERGRDRLPPGAIDRLHVLVPAPEQRPYLETLRAELANYLSQRGHGVSVSFSLPKDGRRESLRMVVIAAKEE